ncbi:MULTISPECIES: polysaccharide pyruvyl transferase family protein [Burkholderia]|uniref:polysaccharide pyruvyl transferase family protein n=1 Tax=Burkholderia TaxID=32008 RepID=UPI00087716E6|nr:MULTISPECIES: polysaccharide pyruvyl transferase family protein [Burkholderia]MBR7911885.1 polysaccharide pyruvyl transferase family protein [Burkholderia vietnamiensis]MBR8229186.1 polysaccharide pyruvyl transferase family protein [Burkholderia vietnamiensis]MCA7987153.1 polysaccharide pyruvyl transferase family protein [Burkholderia vietnamiensis]SCZ45641.1 colanic acid/amylovoran biosynthesis protein [Burkholderia vietnamiensis]SFY37047.1 colanic acid/amylovoran biosynthesis protein [Bur
MKVSHVVVANVFGAVNKGDAALIEVCIDEILEAYPNAEISGIAYQPTTQRAHLPRVTWHERLGNCVSDSIWRRRLCNVVRQGITICYVFLRRPWLLGRLIPGEQRRAIDALGNADIVVSCPGGYLEDSNPSYYANLIQIWAAAKFGAIVVLAPQSVGPIRSRRGRWFAAKILAKASLICVRESESYHFVVEELALPAARVARTGDLAFWHAPAAAATSAMRAELGLAQNEPYIAVSVIQWAFPLATDQAQAKERYVRNICELLHLLYDTLGVRIVIVNQVAADLPVGREIESRCSGIAILDQKDRPVSDVRSIIAGASVFLGSRFHSCIFGLLAGRPLVALSYLPKTSGIMSDLGLSSRVHDIDGFDVHEVAETMISDYRAPTKGQAEIVRAVERYRSLYPRFADLLREAA